MSKYKKKRVSIFCTFYSKPFGMETERHKCYYNAFFPSIHSPSIHILTTVTPKRIFFSNFVKIDDICKKLSTSHFVTYLPKLELVFL